MFRILVSTLIFSFVEVPVKTFAYFYTGLSIFSSSTYKAIRIFCILLMYICIANFFCSVLSLLLKGIFLINSNCQF